MASDDMFRSRLAAMIDMRHPRAVLATRMPWVEIEASLAPMLAHRIGPDVTSRTPICSAPGRRWWPRA